MQKKVSKFDREKLFVDYEAQAPLFTKLSEEALQEVRFALEKTDLKIHSVTSRVKAFKSLCDKATRNDLNQPLHEIRDIVGIRVVALFLGDIDRVVEILESAFEILEIDNKLTMQDPAKFGYLSIHLHAKFPAHYAGSHYDAIKDMPFEIQVRTIAMDAWASASHYLEYKSEEDIPSDLKRDFHALSGLYYVADKHFEMFFRNRQEAVINVEILSKTDEFLDQEINLDTLSAYLARKYPERPQAHISHVSVLVSALRARKLNTLSELDKLLDEKVAFFKVMEAQSFPNGKGSLSSVGVVRLSLADDPLFEPDKQRPGLKKPLV